MDEENPKQWGVGVRIQEWIKIKKLIMVAEQNSRDECNCGGCVGGNNVWWGVKEYKNKYLIIANSKRKNELKNNMKNIKKLIKIEIKIIKKIIKKLKEVNYKYDKKKYLKKCKGWK